MKKVKYLLIVFVILILAFLGIGFYISSEYGAIVKKLVTQTINQSLKSEVKVASIDVSTFDEIPYLSLVFKDVAIMEPNDYQKKPDTLIHVKKLSLQFDILEILGGTYQVKAVEISDGFGTFEINKKGKENFFFWKSDTNSTESSDFTFKLNNVELRNINYSYIDKSKKIGVRTFVGNAQVNGDFSSEKLKLLVKGEFNSTSVRVGDVQYVKKRNLEINTGISINNENGDINFLHGEIRVNRAFTLVASGKISSSNYKFNIGSDKIRLEQLNSLVPEKYADYNKKFSGKGDVQLKVKINGNYTKLLGPNITAEYSLKDGQITEKNKNISISNISFNGLYSNGKERNARSSILEFSELVASFPSGETQGYLKIEDFNKMMVTAKLSGVANLKELAFFVSTNQLQELNGKIDYNVDVLLNLSRLTGKSANLKGSRLFGGLRFYDLSVNFENGLEVRDATGEIKLDNKKAQLIGIAARVQSSNVKINGEVQNALHWMVIRDSLQSLPLRVIASVKADNIDASEFLPKSKENDINNLNQGVQFPFSELQLDLETKVFTWDRFKSENTKAKLLLSNGKMIANPVSFQSMGGDFEGKLILTKDFDNTYKMKLISNNTNTNVQKMFYSFYSFGQEEITHKNINGTASINTVLNAELSSQLEIYMETVESKAEIKIIDGELINYKGFKAVSNYFNSNLLLRGVFKADELEKSLEEVHFDVLQNEIFVKNQKVILPRTTIGTSVMNVNVEGYIDFDGKMDYHLDFDISELMVRDKKKLENNESVSKDEFGGIRVFIHMHGSSENPVVEIDKERRRAFKKSKRSEEKKEFKSALKEEFGWFRSDTSLKTSIASEEFDIEWNDEENDTLKVSAEKTDSLKSNKKSLRNLFKSEEEKETEEFDFGDDDF